MVDPIPWVFFVSEMRRPVVEKELAKLRLSLVERRKLEETMERVSLDRTLHGDIDILTPHMWEIRVRGQNRIIRLLFFSVLEVPVLVAVLAVVKKTQKTPRQWIDLALGRRTIWMLLNVRNELG